MHCEKCWEQKEELSWLQGKSNQRLSDWMDFLTNIPGRLSNECWDYLRNCAKETLDDAPNDRFKCAEWHIFLNDSFQRHDIEFTNIALMKMEEAAETPEEEHYYKNVAACMQKRLESPRPRRPIIHV